MRKTGGVRGVLDLMASVAVIALCGTLAWTHLFAKPKAQISRPAAAQKRPDLPPPSAPVSLDGAARMGSPSATVALIEYSDFQCPYCGVFARTTLPEIRDRYIKTGKVLFAFRNQPLDEIHSTAMIAAQAAQCAGDQGQFWPMHDWIFANQKRLTLTTLSSQAHDLRLDPGAFSRCLYADGVRRVRAEQAEARSLHVEGTPTFFVGRITAAGGVNVTARLGGAKSADVISAALDALLNESVSKQ